MATSTTICKRASRTSAAPWALYRLFAQPDEGEAAALFADDLAGAFYAFAPGEEPGLRAPLRLREKARLLALGFRGGLRRGAGFAAELEPDGSPLRYNLAENRLPELLLSLLDGGRNAVVQLIGQKGIGRAQVLRHFCAETGLRALAVDCRRLFRQRTDLRALRGGHRGGGAAGRGAGAAARPGRGGGTRRAGWS